MTITIKEEDYNKYEDWVNTVVIKRWEHDFVKKIYVIDYEDTSIK